MAGRWARTRMTTTRFYAWLRASPTLQTTAEGKSKPEIIRCLKRFVAREIFGYLCRAPRAVCPEQMAA